MPELPDLCVYLRALRNRVVGERIEKVRAISPFVLRTFDPPFSAVEGRTVAGVRRMGKRLVFALSDELFLVIHLMVAGRLRWKAGGGAPPGKISLASFQFGAGSLFLTEASKKKRASIHVVAGEERVAAMDPGGLEVLDCGLEAFADRLQLRSHTLKRALTDPTLFSGIGNAYSDEILNAAGLSPVALTRRLSDAEVERLFASVRETLETWSARLLAEFGDRFPEAGEITAFRPDFSAHGKFGQPCRRCGAPIQRIRYAENETNYCPRCQTAGKILADRSLSRILKDDWPRSLEDLEERKGAPQS